MIPLKIMFDTIHLSVHSFWINTPANIQITGHAADVVIVGIITMSLMRGSMPLIGKIKYSSIIIAGLGVEELSKWVGTLLGNGSTSIISTSSVLP